MSFLRKLALGIGITFISLTISLYASEQLLGYLDPRSELPPNRFQNGKFYTWGHIVRKNSFGARGAEPTIPKPTETLRVLALGDSLTWGAGVSEEERYTAVTEKILAKNYPETKIEIINLAHSGNPLVRYRDQLLQDGDKLEPDLITVGFCVNDPQPKGQNYSPERQAYISNNSDIIMLLVKLRYYFPNLEKRSKDAFMSFGKLTGAYPDWPQALDRTYQPDSKEWQAFVTALKDIKQWSDDRKLPTPIFINLTQGSSTVSPTFYSKPDPLLKLFMKWYDAAGEAANNAGFETLDPRDTFLKKLDGKILGVNKLDGHPSVAEHHIYAETLAPVIYHSLTNH